jgi:hypothetical protein
MGKIIWGDYFYNLFTFGDGKNKSVFEIIVDDAKVSCDIILSFYGIKINSTNYPDWKYHLKTFINRDFFSLSNDVSLLYDFGVPPDGFDLLLDTIELFDFVGDVKLIRTIKKNFPDDYDLSGLSIDFIKEITKIRDYNIIAGGRYGTRDEKITNVIFPLSCTSKNMQTLFAYFCRVLLKYGMQNLANY